MQRAEGAGEAGEREGSVGSVGSVGRGEAGEAGEAGEEFPNHLLTNHQSPIPNKLASKAFCACIRFSA
jgi:hypothetical protein